MAWFTLTTSTLKKYGTGLQGDLFERLRTVLTDDEIRTNINKIINDIMRERDHIPLDMSEYQSSNRDDYPGRLRDSALVDKEGIKWRTPYAHYVWSGNVYGPNIPVFAKGTSQIIRFVSPKGVKKHPMGYSMNYSLPTTGARWVDIAFSQSGRIINNAVTNYLKKECKRYNV